MNEMINIAGRAFSVNQIKPHTSDLERLISHVEAAGQHLSRIKLMSSLWWLSLTSGSESVMDEFLLTMEELDQVLDQEDAPDRRANA